jgi:hypothetical protein
MQDATMTESPDAQLAAWLLRVAHELNLDSQAISTTDLLEVARDVAHNQVRPGAPTSTYLIGYAVGLWEQQLRSEGTAVTEHERAQKVHELSIRIQQLAVGS